MSGGGWRSIGRRGAEGGVQVEGDWEDRRARSGRCEDVGASEGKRGDRRWIVGRWRRIFSNTCATARRRVAPRCRVRVEALDLRYPLVFAPRNRLHFHLMRIRLYARIARLDPRPASARNANFSHDRFRTVRSRALRV